MGAFREYFGDFCFAREKRCVFFSLFSLLVEFYRF